MSKQRGLPVERKMRHDSHFVEILEHRSNGDVGFVLSVDAIETNREQPRSNLGDLSGLAASIKARGILEPLLVRPIPGSPRFQLIAGERRFQAALEAGLTHVPCIELRLSDQEALEIALIENLQRKDLTPFEEAEGYRTLSEKYGYTHEQIAEAVGKSRTTITEAMRLLSIPPAIRDLCRHADITAKSVLLLIARAESIAEMERLVQEIAEGNLDRHAARALAAAGGPGSTEEAAKEPPKRPESSPAREESAETTGAPQRFRPLQIRFRPTANSPIHLSLSIRRPDVTREELISTLEGLLARIRAGELDEQLPGSR
ncbi:MAG: ParB/RepB/Spo0J family partition protein [Acidobacteriota bacterium]